ncbi:sugar phosphate exchanger 3-like isoform X2 [Amphiura filiformis]|uniref:sugar phosphate exchanger 3-like isoform X2 n=1 Tax=Amphiura filiformis TaxID=82378 RepID=UPI003B223000
MYTAWSGISVFSDSCWVVRLCTMANCGGWSLYHISVFIITFFAYACYNAARKTFSNVKSSIQEEWAPLDDNTTNISTITVPTQSTEEHFLDSKQEAEVFFGVLDTVFLISYAVGLYVCGAIGDRFNLRNVLALGMCLSALSIFMFGTLSAWVNVYSRTYYILFWILNGLLQGTGLPAVVAILGNWFGPNSRGLVFGLWSACQSVGNIMGACLAALVVEQGYEYAFLVTSSLLFIGGVVVILFLVPTPEDVDVPLSIDGGSIIEQEELKERTGSTSEGTDLIDADSDASDEPQAIGFVQAVLLPGVACYSLSYAFLKLVNFSFFFWLPYYLTSQYGWEEKSADEVSIFYDVGGILGGTIGGFLSDRMGVRSPVVIIMLVFSYGILFWYSVSPGFWLINAGIMVLLGFFICGVSHLISAAVAADLGQQEAVRGNGKALATVTGIVDGTGTIGAAIGQILVPLLELNYGWSTVFYFFIGMNIMSTLILMPVFINDLSVLSKRLNASEDKESTSLLHSKAN